MSRIEKALEKALQMRQQNVPEAQPGRSDYGAAEAEAFTGNQPLPVTSPYLIAVQEPSSAVSEEYRKLKSLVVRMTEKKFLNTIMVTSTCRGEGKTITALNLAISLAHACDHTVLLVDANLRQPSVSRYLGIQGGAGLSDYLTSGRDVGSSLVKTGIGRLVVLPAGDTVDNPVELLSSIRMKHLVQELKNRYTDRYVIFDTPAVLNFAEALFLGSCVDGVLFVVGEGQSPLHEVKEAFRLLRDCELLGVVFNNSVSTRFNEGYFSRYTYKHSEKSGNAG